MLALLLLGGCTEAETEPSSTEDPGPDDVVHGPPFVEVAEAAHLLSIHPGTGRGGVAVADVNADGYPDLYITGTPPQSGGPDDLRVLGRLLLNDGDGGFVDSSHDWGLTIPSLHYRELGGAVFADIDGDGDADLLLTSTEGNLLFGHLGTHFEDWTQKSGFGIDTQDSFSVSVSDFDADGYLDAYILNRIFVGGNTPDFEQEQPPDLLLRGQPGGSFIDATALLPTPDVDGAGFAAAWSDFDGDADVDLYVANDHGSFVLPNQMYRNDGQDGKGWAFERTTETCGCGLPISSMGIAIGDYNRDQHKDLFITNLASTGREVMLQGQGDGTFVDASATSGIQQGMEPLRPSSWGTEFFDFNNDGWSDLFVGYSGAPGATGDTLAPSPNLLLQNVEGSFQPVDDDGFDEDEGATVCATVFDQELDGCLDVIAINVYDQPVLYRNQCEYGHNWVGFELQASGPNRDAIGAEVRLQSESGQQHQEVVAGSTSICASRWKTVHFGLGTDSTVEQVEVRWPDGSTELLTEVEISRYHLVRQGDGVVDGS